MHEHLPLGLGDELRSTGGHPVRGEEQDDHEQGIGPARKDHHSLWCYGAGRLPLWDARPLPSSLRARDLGWPLLST